MDYQIRQEMIALMPRLQRFAYSLTGTKADADDLMQSTFLRAIENLDKWAVGSRLDSWMYKMAQNIHYNNIRHNSVTQRHVQSVHSEDANSHDGVKDVMNKNTLKRVSSSIDTLPTEQRSVLLLVAVEGFGYQETATILDVPIGTVTSRLARARQALALDVYGQDG